MNEMVVMFALKLMSVKEIRESESAAVIQFEGGFTGRLTRHDNDKYADSLGNAREGLKDTSPVVVSMAEPDRIVAIGWADSDTVLYVKEHDANRLQVAFGIRAAIYYLRKDNTDLQRVKATLERSAKNKSLVWLSFDQDKMLVVDALPVEHGGKK